MPYTHTFAFFTRSRFYAFGYRSHVCLPLRTFTHDVLPVALLPTRTVYTPLHRLLRLYAFTVRTFRFVGCHVWLPAVTAFYLPVLPTFDSPTYCRSRVGSVAVTHTACVGSALRFCLRFTVTHYTRSSSLPHCGSHFCRLPVLPFTRCCTVYWFLVHHGLLPTTLLHYRSSPFCRSTHTGRCGWFHTLHGCAAVAVRVATLPFPYRLCHAFVFTLPRSAVVTVPYAFTVLAFLPGYLRLDFGSCHVVTRLRFTRTFAGCRFGLRYRALRIAVYVTLLPHTAFLYLRSAVYAPFRFGWFAGYIYRILVPFLCAQLPRFTVWLRFCIRGWVTTPRFLPRFSLFTHGLRFTATRSFWFCGYGSCRLPGYWLRSSSSAFIRWLYSSGWFTHTVTHAHVY